ncbi:Eukaryotic translation initiation factor 5 [Dichanthelium oligosanthes]|uniref:Eukaryotic translation initiation factor 5 n=1 Tax=Dichanthelium oligosanthes TaxID=888268 RepID=A0A1E5WB56_9POAL|nr:Eukaryotic translation initiation factor 5 [Dichanthelium oligosanthes]
MLPGSWVPDPGVNFVGGYCDVGKLGFECFRENSLLGLALLPVFLVDVDLFFMFLPVAVAASVLLQSDKVEGLGVAASFMSEQSLLYLGLLGEYSRATRKRHKLPFHCMPQEPIWFSCSEKSLSKMALQNIGASNRDDAFYRYKMPRMITKIEGRGNGIKTNVVNMVDIAKALARPASYTTKYFGCELGAQSKFDEKTGISLVNGAHDTAKLAGLLEVFIKKYVQCYGCGNPETEILISKAQMISLKCAACGFVSDVDMRDKLTTFILKNPPEQKKGGKDNKKAMRRAEKERLKEGEAADEEQKKLKKDAKKKGASSKESTAKPSKKKAAAAGSDEDHSTSPTRSRDGDNGAADEDDDEDDVQWQTDTSMEAAKQRMQEQLSAATAEMVMLSIEETEKKKKQATHKEATANGSAISEPVITKPSPYDELVGDIKASLGSAATPTQLKAVLASSTLPPQDVMNALLDALFDGVGKGFAKEVVKNKKYLAAAVPDEDTQTVLVQAIEAFGGKCSPEALKEVPVVLKALYDGDVLEEETIVDWYNAAVAAGKNSQVMKNAKPFVEWLQSAESEEEDDE